MAIASGPTETSIPLVLQGHNIRCSGISLRRRQDRWDACEEHLRHLVPPGVEFRMVDGVDGSSQSHLLPDVDAVEEALGMKLYRDWPVCDTTDLYRLFPEVEGLDDFQAWTWYRKKFRSFWKAHRADMYVDCYARQTTVGEIGCALSHLKVIEDALQDGIDIQIVFEDDARPAESALPTLLRQIALMQESSQPWDLIYLRSSKYDNVEETPYFVDSPLLVAGHRKTTDAFTLSRAGMEKIASSGFRECLFAIDDFLPALYSGHPRPDVEALPCVQRVREQGFVALVFPDSEVGDNSLCANLNYQSETNATSSPPVIGDEGMFECS